MFNFRQLVESMETPDVAKSGGEGEGREGAILQQEGRRSEGTTRGSSRESGTGRHTSQDASGGVGGEHKIHKPKDKEQMCCQVNRRTKGTSRGGDRQPDGELSLGSMAERMDQSLILEVKDEGGVVTEGTDFAAKAESRQKQQVSRANQVSRRKRHLADKSEDGVGRNENFICSRRSGQKASFHDMCYSLSDKSLLSSYRQYNFPPQDIMPHYNQEFINITESFVENEVTYQESQEKIQTDITQKRGINTKEHNNYSSSDFSNSQDELIINENPIHFTDTRRETSILEFQPFQQTRPFTYSSDQSCYQNPQGALPLYKRNIENGLPKQPHADLLCSLLSRNFLLNSGPGDDDYPSRSSTHPEGGSKVSAGSLTFSPPLINTSSTFRSPILIRHKNVKNFNIPSCYEVRGEFEDATKGEGECGDPRKCDDKEFATRGSCGWEEEWFDVVGDGGLGSSTGRIDQEQLKQNIETFYSQHFWHQRHVKPSNDQSQDVRAGGGGGLGSGRTGCKSKGGWKGSGGRDGSVTPYFTKNPPLTKRKTTEGMRTSAQPGSPSDGEQEETGTHRSHSPPLYRCGRCGVVVRGAETLLRHQRLHAPTRPYACRDCPSRFNQLVHLQIHRRTHTGERPFRCSLCDSSFSRKDRLRSHERTHSDERPYSCPYCSASFRDAGCLKRHITSHARRLPFTCPTCHATFAHLATFTSHWRQHTSPT